MLVSRITIFAGHYGSGKTHLALNYAVWLKETNSNVVICDLDIVNPYFRTADSADLLEKRGIKLITSAYANTNVDLPAIPSAAKSVFENKDISAVIDLGGDDRGALAIGRYTKSIINENNYEMLLVVNKYRPFTRDADALIEIKNEIEHASGIRFTGIVNNSNLGLETTFSDVLDTAEFACEISERIGLPLKMTAVSKRVLNNTEDAKVSFTDLGSVFPIDIYEKTLWKV